MLNAIYKNWNLDIHNLMKQLMMNMFWQTWPSYIRQELKICKKQY